MENSLTLLFDQMNKTKTFSPEFLTIFPDILPCNGTLCPMEFWRSYGCELYSNKKIIFKIGAVETSPSLDVLEADTFRIIRTHIENGTTFYCFYQYSGLEFTLYNSENNCSQDIIWKPMIPNVPETIFLFNNICDGHSPSRRTWTKEWCEPWMPITGQDIVQVKADEKYFYLYCYQQKLSVENHPPIRCSNVIYKIDRQYDVTINGIRLPVEKSVQEHTLDIETYVKS